MKTINTTEKKETTPKTQTKKKQNKKKAKKMYANGLYGAVVQTANQVDLLPPEEAVNISLSNSKRNRGYIFVDHKNIQEIYEKSGPLAKDNEFQVHYWFLNFRYTAPDGSRIDIAVPTCYFNYEQFVTSGHIDFELTDVIPVSEALEPVHNMKVNQIMKTDLHIKINELFGVEFEPMSVNFGTLHRHPGQSGHQSFSSTDLNVNVRTKQDSLGVVFPLATAEDDKPSFSMIIAVDGQTNHYYNPSIGIANLAHAEYRIANGDIKTGLNYEKNRCIAFNIKKTTKPSVIEKMFGAKEVSNTIVKFDNTESVLIDLEQRLVRLFESLYDDTYTASTDVIIEANVKKKVNTVAIKTTKTTTSTSYYYNEDEIEAMYAEFNNTTETEKSLKEKKDDEKAATKSSQDQYTKNMKVSEKEFLDASTKLTNYEKNEDIQVLLDVYKKKQLTYPMTYASLEKCVKDYNCASKAYYGTPDNQLEQIETYVMEIEGNFTYDERDITDFINEIYLMLGNILLEQAEFRKTISMYKMLNPSNVNKEVIEETVAGSEDQALPELAQEPDYGIFKKAVEAVGTLFHKDQEQK